LFLLRGIGRVPDKDSISLMVLSDHGMAARAGWMDPAAVLNRHHIGNRTLASGGSANVYLRRRSDLGRARSALAGMAGLEVFVTGGGPDDLHYDFPGRTGDLVLVAPPGIELGKGNGPGDRGGGGVHGYRGTQDEMGGIFFGWGRAFPAGGQVGRVEAVDVYRIACEILGLRPSGRSQGKLPRGVLSVPKRDLTPLPAR
jgi:type I phosphodiesterase/nucleotide pyrophosphatase